MKNYLLLFSMLLFGLTTAIAQSIATNFTADDCDGNSHDLFTELDAGKVVVIAWVMPCGVCIGPALTAYNVSQSYDPDKVIYFLVDDYGNTNCTTLTNWGTTNNIGPNLSSFSNSAISMSDYGSSGMPKVVVVGGTSHTIYFNEINANAGDVNGLEDAIDAALTALTGINDAGSSDFDLNLSVNASSSVVSINYVLTGSANVSIEIFNMLGQKVKTFPMQYQIPGNYKSDFSLGNFGSGIYFLKFNFGRESKVMKFNIPG